MLDTTERLAIEDRLEAAKEDWAHPMVRAVLLDAWKLLAEVERLRHEVAKVPPSVWELMDRHAGKWGEKPTSYWFYRLSEEVGELGSSLAGHHGHLGDDPVELELAEIASICINWLMRKGNA